MLNAAIRTAALLLLWLGAPVLSAQADPCPHCWALVVMPDTQNYTQADRQPAGGRHLDLVARYICKNRSAWTEPATGKQMPIAMVIQLGDLVQSEEIETEWRIVRGAFDRLERCGVPHLVTLGNHDIPSERYQNPTPLFDAYFGVERWSRNQCADPTRCSGGPGNWFIGGGEEIRTGSRGRSRPVCTGRGSARKCPGPRGRTAQPGRHRAGIIRTPSGSRVLFLGVELAFDFPVEGRAAAPENGDDLRWILRVLGSYPGVPAILFHHLLFDRVSASQLHTVPLTGTAWSSDTLGDTKTLWETLVEPNSQIRMTFNGHWKGKRPREAYQAIPRRAPGATPVHAFFANYQGKAKSKDMSGYGGGWNLIVAFDPDAGEIRPRSYRIVGTSELPFAGEPRSIGPEDARLLDFVKPSPFPRLPWVLGQASGSPEDRVSPSPP